LEKDGLIDQNNEFVKDAAVLVQDNEFISQIQTLRGIIKSTADITYFDARTKLRINPPNQFFTPNARDRYMNFMRNNKILRLKKYTDGNVEPVSKGLSDNIENIQENWINNYDYNKIFNIKNPPIKAILSPYLDDPMFQNFYLFFVTSNNVKVADTGNLDTCGKQIQLMYDTRHFMEVIAKNDPNGVSGQCR
jgi:hypothetical protein